MQHPLVHIPAHASQPLPLPAPPTLAPPHQLAAIRVYRRDLNNNAKVSQLPAHASHPYHRHRPDPNPNANHSTTQVVEHLNMGMAPLPLHTLIEKVPL